MLVMVIIFTGFSLLPLFASEIAKVILQGRNKHLSALVDTSNHVCICGRVDSMAILEVRNQ
jgi:hypothetical protein